MAALFYHLLKSIIGKVCYKLTCGMRKRYFVLLFLSVVAVSLLQLGDGGQRIFYLNNPGDYEQA